MKGRKVIEKTEEQKRNQTDLSPSSISPAKADVVFKAGTSNVCHPGNVVFRELLAYHNDYFCDCTCASKQRIVSMIVEDIIRRGGHFLEWDSTGVWVVIKDQALFRTKIYNSLLYFKKVIEAKKNLQCNQSSTFLFERQDGRKRKRENDGSDPPSCADGCL